MAGRRFFSSLKVLVKLRPCSSELIGGDRDYLSILFWKNLAEAVSDLAFSSEFVLL